jgi:hypothetical protein
MNGRHLWRLKQDQRRRGLFLTITADGLDRAALESFFALGALIVIFRLLVEEGVTSVIITLKVSRRSLAAKVTINALIVHVISTGDVLGVFVSGVGHDSRVWVQVSGPG